MIISEEKKLGDSKNYKIIIYLNRQSEFGISIDPGDQGTEG
jgi:hypothetical protein